VHYFTYLKESFDPEEAEAKIDNIKELLRAVTFFEQSRKGTIQEFLDEVALMQEKVLSKEDNQNTVKLMTLHAAKGLEFDVVALTGLEEGLFPNTRSLMEDGLEEERRLFYVGITRAKERLLLMHARHRYTFGSMNDQKPSRFINEIPSHLAPTYDIAYWNEAQLHAFFSEWIGASTTSHILTFGSAISTPPIAPEKKPFVQQSQSSLSWKENQSIKHKTFGIGIIKAIEHRGKDTYFITAEFKSGIKKIKSDFIEAL
jgi:DNA helicase-2/ATP-dependent DNA helicase PcrA